jgi:hypothetical protein
MEEDRGGLSPRLISLASQTLPGRCGLCRSATALVAGEGRLSLRHSRKPKVFYHSFQYQAKSWKRPRRIVAKVECHVGELLPRVGFIVMNLTWRSKRVVRFHNGRGTAEQWTKEGKNAIKWTKLSCRTFQDNQTRLQLFVLAYNLANSRPRNDSAATLDGPRHLEQPTEASR